MLKQKREARSLVKDNNKFAIVRNSTERFFFKNFLFIIPFIYLLRTFIQYLDNGEFPYALLSVPKMITETALMLSIFFTNRLFSTLHNDLLHLFLDKAFFSKKGGHSIAYFFDKLDTILNHPKRKVLGLSVALIVFIYYSGRVGAVESLPSLLNSIFSLHFLDVVLYVLPSVFYAYFVGIVIWKLWFISRSFTNLLKIFDINIRYFHPDDAGGLLPIGELILKMVYITVTPTVLSVILLLAPFLVEYFDITDRLISDSLLLYGFAPLILFAGIVGNIIVLIPLFNFHKIMMERKINATQLIIHVSSQIIELKFNIVNNPNQDKIDEILKTLSVLEGFYKKHKNINTWPLNRRILAEILSTQTLLIGQVIGFWDLISKTS